ncbi:hypothetical protein BH24PSE2_BH24PSE2_14280 [soil metagenome]
MARHVKTRARRMQTWLVVAWSLPAAFQAAAAEELAVPAWFEAHLSELTDGGGRWIAGNAAYRGDGEPYEVYGIEWRRALSDHSVTGRLFGFQDGRQTEDFWEFRIYWDGAARTGVIEQFNGAGVVGRGSLVGFGPATLTDQTFTDPRGRQWRELHHAWFEGDVYVTQSYDWEDGSWVPRRAYRWKQIDR